MPRLRLWSSNFWIVSLLVISIPCVTTLLLATAFAQTEWEEFTAADGNFRVLFPDDPQQKTGTEQNLHQFSTTGGSESYGLVYSDYSPGTGWENAVNTSVIQS